MSSSQVPAAISALVAALETALGAAIVFDGPEITGDIPAVAVIVGYDGDAEGDFRAVENWSQEYVGLGALRKEEGFDILGCVVAFTGDTTIADKRASVFATFATVETTLRTATLAGLGLAAPALAEFSAGEFYQEQTGSGLQCRIPFIVSVSHVRI